MDAGSDDFNVTGLSFGAEYLTADHWARFSLYNETSELVTSDPNGVGFHVLPGDIGIFGPGPFPAMFERTNTLARLDVARHVATYRGLDVFAGATAAHIGDHFEGDITATAFPGTTMDIDFRGTSVFVGPMIGARYTIPTGGSLGPVSLDAFGSLAALYGRHSHSYSAISVGALILNENNSDSESGFSAAAEFGMTASYQFNDIGRFALTYQVSHYTDAINSAAGILATNRGLNTTQAITDAVTYHGLSLSMLFEF